MYLQKAAVQRQLFRGRFSAGISSHQYLVSRSSLRANYKCLLRGSSPLAAPFALAVLGNGLSGLLRETARVGQDRGHLDDLKE